MNAPVSHKSFMALVSESYASYSRHVLGHRHFPEGRDGLLPVQRRAIWTMHRMGADSRAHSTKTAKASGYTTGDLHPHGEASVSRSIANMSQFAMRYPLTVGIGNFGWHDAPPSAPRYTSVHLSEYACTMLDASELTAVPMDDAYDGKNQEPRYLPARLPHVLVGGCQSLAPGYRGNIPPCEADWVLHAVRATMERTPLRTPRRFAYRWGGDLTHMDEGWLDTGACAARFAPVVRTDGNRVLVTTLAPGLKASRMAAILEESPALGSFSEETPEKGEHVRMVCTLRRGADVRALHDFAVQRLNGRQDYAFLTIRQYETRHGVDYEPVTEGPRAFLRKWVAWRTGVVSSAAQHRADRHRDEIVRLRLTVRAIESRKRLIGALDQARDKPDLVRRVVAILACSTEEATWVVDLAFHRLAFMNMTALRARIDAHVRERKAELAVRDAPAARLLQNAEETHASMLRSEQHTIRADRPKKREKRT